MVTTNNHNWTLPDVGGSEDQWGSILNDFFRDLDIQIMLDGPLADRPDASSTDLKYYHSTDEAEDTIYYNTGSSWEVLSLGSSSSGQNNLNYVSGHISWEPGLVDEEIHRFTLDSGSSFSLQSLEFKEKGGGVEDSFATLSVYDFSQSTELASINLNTKSSVDVSSSSGSVILFRLSNETGSTIDAGITIRGTIE